MLGLNAFVVKIDSLPDFGKKKNIYILPKYPKFITVINLIIYVALYIPILEA